MSGFEKNRGPPSVPHRVSRDKDQIPYSYTHNEQARPWEKCAGLSASQNSLLLLSLGLV